MKTTSKYRCSSFQQRERILGHLVYLVHSFPQLTRCSSIPFCLQLLLIKLGSNSSPPNPPVVPEWSPCFTSLKKRLICRKASAHSWVAQVHFFSQNRLLILCFKSNAESKNSKYVWASDF